MSRRSGRPLDRKLVMDTAFALLRDEGLAALSMRRLAQRLDVQAPAIYWHFADKGELLGLMASSVYLDAREGVGQCTDWRSWLFAYGSAFRKRLGREKDSAQLCAVAPPVAGGAPGSPRAIASPLIALGLDQASALSAIASVTSLALGWSTFEANGPMHSFLEEMLDFDQSFEAGLRALVDGFQPLDIQAAD